MIKQPYFSIIIPVYNVEKYLQQCIDSIIAQTVVDYEVILIDDGSVDASPQICDKYARTYDSINVYHISNSGPSKARNIGVSHARGKYITFMDSDDFWQHNKVLEETMYLIKKHSSPDVIASDIIKYYDHRQTFISPPKICSEALNGRGKIEVLEYLYFEHADLKMSACQKFIRQDIAKQITFTDGLFSEDIEWSLQLYVMVQTICLNSHPYYCYRQLRPGSRSTTPPVESFKSVIFIIDKWENKIREMNVDSREAQVYLGYLAYQLCMAINLYTTLPKNLDKAGMRAIKEHIHLFNYKVNYKTQKIKMLVRFFGIEIAAWVIKKYIRWRASWHKL